MIGRKKPSEKPSKALHKIETLLARGGYISDYEKIAIAKLVLQELSHNPLAVAALKIL